MTGNNSTLKVKLNVRVPGDLRAVSKSFLKALLVIDKLYGMQAEGQVPGTLSRAAERSAWNEAVDIISGSLGSIREESRQAFAESLKVLKGGIYDLYPLTVQSGDNPDAGVELIIGKVFLSAGGGDTYYSGASGVLNNGYRDLIDRYDRHMPLFAEKLGVLNGGGDISAPENIPELKCLDLFSLSGGINPPHKPICVFFSGGGKENVSSLSNMTVFINLYRTRFKEITQRISDRYLPWTADMLSKKSDDDIARLLLIWLRGHDVGHFFGADNLGKEMSEFDMDYMILHELKSDYISLYNMRFIDFSTFGSLTKEEAYAAAVSEIFRYIRRGGVYKYPDSGSAYLTYMALCDTGALKYDEVSGTYSFDAALFEKTVSDCTSELLRLFSEHSAQEARAYVNRWGMLKEQNPCGIPRSCPGGLLQVINDDSIARLIEYSFVI